MADALKPLAGKWKLDRTENAEELLTAMGWDAELRKKALAAKATHDITVESDTITIVIDAEFITRTEKFKLGEEFESDNHGKKAKMIASAEGGKLVVKPSSGDADAKIPISTRSVTADGEMCMVGTLGNIVCTSYLKKV